ncbi:MAG: hypothetical protein RL375_3522 [Pseudomonadota bacterium]|jgi:OmcA/MtrC family decaheme c-type cytochrome
MKLHTRPTTAWAGVLAAGLMALTLASCGGGGGNESTPPPPPIDVPISGIATGQAGLAASTTLTVTVTAVRLAGKPEVDFTVVNQSDLGMTGLKPADLRFNIAKLVPAADGGPSNWQNYINRVRSGAVQGSQERVATGSVFGTLIGHGGGAYTYTFATDITDPAANPCPAPCTDVQGRPLDIGYSPSFTHRVTVQQANSAYPEATGVFDFVPSGGPVLNKRDIVATETCNTCHKSLKAHGTRVDTRLCVTCHNPGSWVAASGSTPAATVDFKVMAHRIHYNNAGAALPSVVAGVPYKIGGADFSHVAYPQDARGCTRCHDSTAGALTTATGQGDRWKTQPSIAACGACHDNVYFGAAPDAAKPYQTKAHSGGAMSDDAACASCHAAGRYTDRKDIAIAHDFPARLAAAVARFDLRILSVTATAPGQKPVVTFSVVDPSNGNAPYDIKTATAFVQPGGVSSLAVKIGWTTAEFDNTGSGLPYGQPVTINALGAAAVAGPSGSFTVTSPVAVPAGLAGSVRVVLEGHPAGDVTAAGRFTDRLPVKTVVKDVDVAGGAVVARRSIVDIAKCDTCHGRLSLHGANRNDDLGACVVCHNPNATDASRRPASGAVDGKVEESVDFKTLIHGLHAGQATLRGLRTKGLVIYGFGGSVNDFSAVGFPGDLADCSTCHVGTSYTLTGAWAAPASSGIAGTTVTTGGPAAAASSYLRMSPTVAVCSSCHDRTLARLHMEDSRSGGSFSATAAQLGTTVIEVCATCHGPGQIADVKTMHGVQ